MRKKQKKSKEEKIAENYFPVDESNLKNTIEKPYKKLDISKIETIEKPKKKISPKKRKSSAKKKKSKTKKVTYSYPKTKLKKSGYELVITEKPQAAMKIAAALGKSEKIDSRGAPYYEVSRKGKKIVVACAVGHLFTLKQNVTGSSVPIFDIVWIPNYLARKKDFTKKYYDTLLKLMKNASSLTVATDYDTEGEVIGLNVVRFIGNQKDANRMKFSTLTTDELNKAYDNKSPSIDWGQAIAGETRHYLDWFYGINLSRALMNAIKTTGSFKIMSIGRVQGPALNLIVQKEKEIQKFKPETYWQVFADIKNTPKLTLKHNKNISKEEELEKFQELKGKETEATTKKKEQIIPPNPPFNLTTLQTEAYKFHSIAPIRTMRAAQSLYLSGLISYPRTSSQKLPKEIDYKSILKILAERNKVQKLIKRKTPIEGKKTDPAHPSIYPTGNYQILAGDEEKIYNLIVKRFLSLFCEEAVIENKTISINVDKLKFSTKGVSIIKPAWMDIYPSKLKQEEIPDVNGKVKITKIKTEEKETQPPKRYSPASILSELEKRNLGTKATRANILETLHNRGYVKDTSIKATPLGISLISTLEKYSSIIIDEALTRDFENQMDSIRESKSKFKEKEDKIIENAKKTIIKIAKQFEKSEKEIGQELQDANIKLRDQEKEENKLNICPKCKKGNLAITYSRKTRRHFIACNAYPDCKTTYSLPPKGKVKKTKNICEECGFPKLMILKAGRRPWIFCFNDKCPTNKERIEEYKKKQEEENKEKN
jgi:DNA topoisomerase I